MGVLYVIVSPTSEPKQQMCILWLRTAMVGCLGLSVGRQIIKGFFA
jgi:hypothetical protein